MVVSYVVETIYFDAYGAAVDSEKVRGSNINGFFFEDILIYVGVYRSGMRSSLGCGCVRSGLIMFLTLETPRGALLFTPIYPA